MDQAKLEKQIKELNVRIVDFETKSYGTPSRPSANTRRLESRIEELMNRLNQVTKDKGENSRMQWSVDMRDTNAQLAESDRQRARLEEEMKSYESQILNLRQAMDVIVRELFARLMSLDSKPMKVTFSLRNVEPSGRLRI